MKSYIIAFWNFIKLGHIIMIVNPTFEGYFTSIPLIECKGILPNKEVIDFCNTINMNNTLDERYIFTCFTADKFRLRSAFSSKYLCKGAYGSEYRRDYYYLK